MKAAPIFLLLFIAALAPADAITSEFVILTPLSDRRHDQYQPRVTTDPANPAFVDITVPFYQGGLHSWLIIAEQPLPRDQLEFREIIWGKPNPGYVQLIVPLHEKSASLNSSEPSSGYTHFSLKKSLLPRSYICTDYRTEVDDGGYYYTVDLSQYYHTPPQSVPGSYSLLSDESKLPDSEAAKAQDELKRADFKIWVTDENLFDIGIKKDGKRELFTKQDLDDYWRENAPGKYIGITLTKRRRTKEQYLDLSSELAYYFRKHGARRIRIHQAAAFSVTVIYDSAFEPKN